MQPLKATEMDALPEGRRGSHAVKVYSDTELYMADQGLAYRLINSSGSDGSMKLLLQMHTSVVL